MRILVIARDAGSLRHGMVFRYHYLAREWASRGCTVDILATAWSHVRTSNPDRTEKEAVLGEGIVLHWLSAHRYKGSGLGRVLSMLRFALQIWWRAPRLATQFRPDAVIVSSPDPLQVHGALRIARLSGAVCVFDVRDLWPLTLVGLGGVRPSHPFVRLLQLSEDRACRECDAVVSVQPYALRHLQSRGLTPERYAYLPNGFWPDDWSGAEHVPPTEIVRLRSEHRILVGYFGSHGLANSLDVLLEVAARVDPAEIGFVLVGQGVLKEQLIAQARSRGLKHVHFFDPVPKTEVPAWIGAVDVAFVAARKTGLYDFGISFNKLFDYFAAARPILFAADVSPDPVALAGAGVSVSPGVPANVAEALERLARLPPAELREMGERGRRWATRNHDYRNIAAEYLDLLRQLRSKRFGTAIEPPPARCETVVPSDGGVHPDALPAHSDGK